MKPQGTQKFTLASTGIARIRTEFHAFMVSWVILKYNMVKSETYLNIFYIILSFQDWFCISVQVNQPIVARRRKMWSIGDSTFQIANARISGG